MESGMEGVTAKEAGAGGEEEIAASEEVAAAVEVGMKAGTKASSSPVPSPRRSLSVGFMVGSRGIDAARAATRPAVQGWAVVGVVTAPPPLRDIMTPPPPLGVPPPPPLGVPPPPPLGVPPMLPPPPRSVPLPPPFTLVAKAASCSIWSLNSLIALAAARAARRSPSAGPCPGCPPSPWWLPSAWDSTLPSADS